MNNNENKDFVSNEVHLSNDPSINVLNQDTKYKESIKKQKNNSPKKSKYKTILWFLGLIVLNVLLQVLGYYGNHDYYTGFEFNLGGCIWGSIAYCFFSLLISALSERAKNPEFYEAIDKARVEARQKQIEELKKQAEEDKKHKPKCPTCGCENVRRISSAERGVNAVAFGIYGTKRKCQFECQNPNCKYKW